MKAVLNDDVLYEEAASEAFPLYNKSHLISLEMPDRIGDVCFLILFSVYSFSIEVSTFLNKGSLLVLVFHFDEFWSSYFMKCELFYSFCCMYLCSWLFFLKYMELCAYMDYIYLSSLCEQVIVTSFGQLNETEFIDPRTAQVAVVDHIKQASLMLPHT